MGDVDLITPGTDESNSGFFSSKRTSRLVITNANDVNAKDMIIEGTTNLDGNKKKWHMKKKWKSCFFMILWANLILIGAMIGAWAWIYHTIYKTLTHTFAWERLLMPLGSLYDECVDHDRVGEKKMYINMGRSCHYSYTMPCVPIISMTILCFMFVNGIGCVFSKSYRKSNLSYIGVKNWVIWQTIFFTITFITVSVFFYTSLESLESKMLHNLGNKDPYKVTRRWEVTQLTNQCCGMTNYTTWNAASNEYPFSCCNFEKSSCNDSSEMTLRKFVNKKGCFEKEYDKIIFYGSLELIFLFCSFFFTTIFYCLLSLVFTNEGPVLMRKEIEEDITTEEIRVVLLDNHNQVTYDNDKTEVMKAFTEQPNMRITIN